MTIEESIAELKKACDEAVPSHKSHETRKCCLCGSVEELHQLWGTKAWLCDGHNKLKEDNEQYPF
jgi:hypothetical protein